MYSRVRNHFLESVYMYMYTLNAHTCCISCWVLIGCSLYKVIVCYMYVCVGDSQYQMSRVFVHVKLTRGVVLHHWHSVGGGEGEGEGREREKRASGRVGKQEGRKERGEGEVWEREKIKAIGRVGGKGRKRERERETVTLTTFFFFFTDLKTMIMILLTSVQSYTENNR